MPAEPSYANEKIVEGASVESNEWLSKVFKNADQQGLEAFEKQEFDKASSMFADPMWKGAALYKNKDYEAALEAFKRVPGAESAYNQANALARLGQLEQAIEKYDEALQERPGHTNAMANKKLVEDLLQQQEQQKQDGQQQDGQDKQSGDPQNNEQQSDEQNEEEQSGEQQSGEQQQGEQQDSEQDQNESDSEDTKGDEEQKQSEQQKSEEESKEAEGKEPEEGKDGENAEGVEQKSNLQQQKPLEEMTQEEKEQMQRMQMLMNKIPDDPAFLLQRKMLLESQKRRLERFSRPNKKDW